MSVLVGLVVVLVLFWTSEPVYRGRPLSSWLNQCADTPLENTNQLVEAQNAIRAIGAKKSLPILLKLVRAKDGHLNRWASDTCERFNLKFFHWRSELDCELMGMAGFEVLGTNAAPAVGALTRLLDDKEKAFTAVQCLDHIGKLAESALCQSLTNSNPQAREWGVSALAGATDDVEVYISRIKGCLNDPDFRVRVATVQAIGAQKNAPDLAMPLLIGALNHRDVNVSSEAANEIRGFGTNGVSAFSALTNLVAQGVYLQAQPALRTLAAIAPVEAAPVLSNIVVHGTDLTDAALSSLKPIAPELCLQMTLAELRAPDVQRRLRALGTAGSFEIETPGIAPALRSAAENRDPQLSANAKIIIRTMLREKKERGPVKFADDPSYQGKTLSEWLQMRQESNLETNAVEALRHMGTNVIPALLHRIEYKDPIFGLDDSDVSMEGVSGLINLGEQAKPALPRLSELMDVDDRSLAFYAMIAAVGTGRDAIPCLMKGLTNRFPDVRSEAANMLTGEWSAQFREERKQVIPFLVKLLNDPDRFVRQNVTNQLKALDPRAAANAGIK